MSVESAEDRASMFHDEEFAEAASYLAPGDTPPGLHCTPIINRARGGPALEKVDGRGDIEILGWERSAMIRVDELPLVEERGSLTVDLTGEVFEVATVRRDKSGQIWLLELLLPAEPA